MDTPIVDSQPIENSVFVSHGTLNMATTSLEPPNKVESSLNIQQTCIYLMRKVGSTLKEFKFETNKVNS
jgi:hypothetical protein